ncbi:glycosyltransferase family 2 protein [Pseudorhodoferax sp. Leaf265]|jgi:glycosyltransferase involved in cell wall biosynthesis|uniref:glycosyltransferase family 2 protein n=1 Tax=Pseudorhodoferax sp. Leaf265 TaxID=1736315 RepID=UPI0006FD005A|nr:glycosyltransferase family 2 protein [Pseudorhodoferax sp. Leaf265]KQP03050.1 glycosyl transferase [Pseudorhodoferax sp. Leaf265]
MHTTVITVSFNSAATLARTLASVATQSYPYVEHIVVDGGSTDGTVDLVHQHGAHLAHFISEPDRGIYDAMNKGLRIASGDVIAFLNADDRYANGQVLERVAALMEREGLDALLGDVAFFHAQAPDRLVRRYDSGRFRPERLGWGWMPAHPASFFRRSVFVQTGEFRTDYRIAGDYEWIARAFQRSPLRYRHVPEVLVHMQTGGISTRGWRSTLVLNQEVLRACRENGIPTHWAKILSKYPRKLLEWMRR